MDNDDQKIAFFCVPSRGLADAIHPKPKFDRALWAKYVREPPIMPSGIGIIDFTNNNLAMLARLCCDRCCPHYNDSFWVFGNGDEGKQQALHHVRVFHGGF